ncbi:alpha/beta fold hydrolase [Streptomyces sp. WAC04770]|nr:alpha/beta fold hydrolase [Streptomyces sp. WAC04770]RST24624.1 alpha/beta fold hydrolase [Streptomyces sp. WAC04770]
MRETTVTVHTGDDTPLGGTLTLPEGNGPFPAVLILHGSGPLDRDGNTPRLKADLGPALASALAREGMASLRYDRRGTGSTPGDWRTCGYFGNRTDAAAAVRLLKSHTGIDPDGVGVVGHSEGALHAMGLAAGGDVAAAVVLAGYARSGESALSHQARSVRESLPAPLRLPGRLIAASGLPSRLLNRIKAGSADRERIAGGWVNARWMREMLAHDTREDLASIRVPVLAVTGGKDLQVDPDDLKEIARLVQGEVETHRPADLTHLLRRTPSEPTLLSYRRLLREPVDPGLLTLVTTWLRPRLTGTP